MSEAAPPAAPASYSTAQVARMLGVTMPTVQRWVDQGLLKAWKTLGGHRRVDAASADALLQERRAIALPVAPADAADGARPLRIVVIDDNPDDRDLIAAVCQEAFASRCEITLAENGFQGLVAIGAQVPDLVVTDIVMPKMDGLELIAQLSRHASAAPRLIVAVTSLAPDELPPGPALPAGVRLLRKPLDSQRLVELLRAGLPTP
jgi:excisionase family DNA binding protein